jgi:TatD DNase family protein
MTSAMVDCHTHLTDAAFDADRDAVLGRAAEAGVARIALVGQDPAENEAVLRMAGGEPRFLAFLGLHPDRFADRLPPPDDALCVRVIAQIRNHRPALCGIGEVGLDHWVTQDEQRRAAQAQAFAALIDLAQEMDLPLNVHSRSAGRRAIELLLAKGAKRVLMHAFDGKAGHAMRGAEAGYLFSIPPSIVRSPQKQKLVKALPLAALALETDSPVLGPEAQVRNEPANLALVVRALAEIKGVSEDEVCRRTSENAARLFRLDG